MGIKGDFGKLDSLLASLRGAGDLPGTAAQAAAPAMEGLIQGCFARQQDPDGTPWAPKADGSPRTLGSIGDSLTVSADGDSIKVDSDKEHAAYHADRFLPSGDLPSDWKKEIGDKVRADLIRKLRG